MPDEITVSVAHFRQVFLSWLDDAVPDPTRTPEQAELLWTVFLELVTT